MNRYVLGAVLAVLAYVGASSGQEFVSQLMGNVSDPNEELSNTTGSDGLTPVQRVGQNAQRESDAPPVVSSENFGAPVEEAPTSQLPGATTADPNVNDGSIGDFAPAQQPQPEPAATTIPVDNSIPALW